VATFLQTTPRASTLNFDSSWKKCVQILEMNSKACLEHEGTLMGAERFWERCPRRSWNPGNDQMRTANRPRARFLKRA
jgi:hypothetical protein